MPSEYAAPRADGDWRADPETVAPTVLVVGGFLTAPPLYRRLARRLRRHGAADVVVAPIWTPDWLLAATTGFGPIVRKAHRGLLRAARRSRASPKSRGAPVLVIGHSAGGIVARILTATEPFAGRSYAAAESIGAIVTLGSPHAVGRATLGRRLARLAAEFCERHVPGAFHAPRVGYVAVASRRIVGRVRGWPGRALFAYRVYQSLLPRPEAALIEGDGVVPLAAARLAGAREVVVDGAVHGHFGGGPWYGSEGVVDAWWPTAVEVWRAALRARLADATARGPGLRVEPDAGGAGRAADPAARGTEAGGI